MPARHSVVRDHIIFADAFALSRWDPSGGVKNDYKACPPPARPLSVRKGEAEDELWTEYHHGSSTKSVVLSVETLKPLRQDPKVALAMASTGELLWIHRGMMDGNGMWNYRLAADGKSKGQAAPLVDELAWGKLASTPIRLLEPGDTECAPDVACTASGDELVLSHSGNAGETQVLLFDVTAKSAVLRLGVVAPSDAIVQVLVAPDALVLTAWSPARARLIMQRVDRNGEVAPLEAMDAIGNPALDGERIVYQRDEDTIVARSTSSSTSAEETTWSIAAVTSKARNATKKPLALDNKGPGKVVAGAGRVLFVPWHRSSLVDLDSGQEFPRKLKKAVQTVCDAFAAWEVENRTEAARVGIHDLMNATVKSGELSLTLAIALRKLDGLDFKATAESCAREVASKLGVKAANWGASYL